MHLTTYTSKLCRCLSAQIPTPCTPTLPADRAPPCPAAPTAPSPAVGSFPQTAEVRRLRAQLKSGALTRPEYERAIDQQIALAIGIQVGARATCIYFTTCCWVVWRGPMSGSLLHMWGPARFAQSPDSTRNRNPKTTATAQAHHHN